MTGYCSPDNYHRRYQDSVPLIILAMLITSASCTISAFGAPAFSHTEIIDGYEPLTEVYSDQQKEKGYENINILSANYLSDGKYLNSTIWLAYPLYNYGKLNSIRSYGMLIDADFNNNTGIQGADYRLRIEWNGTTWKKVFEELETPISPITPFPSPTKILQTNENYTKVIGQLKRNFVELSADLSLMGSPERYRVSFYAGDVARDTSSWVIDFTDWVSIPPPQIEISVVPSPLVIPPGSSNITEIQIKSTAGYEPYIDFPDVNDTKNGITLDFLDSTIRIPAHGIASTHLNVTVSANISEYRYTEPIEVILTVSPSSAARSGALPADQNDAYSRLIIPTNVKNQQLHQQGMLPLIVRSPPPPPGPLDILINWLSPIGSLVTTLVAIISGIVGGVIAIIKLIKYKRAKTGQQRISDYTE